MESPTLLVRLDAAKDPRNNNTAHIIPPSIDKNWRVGMIRARKQNLRIGAMAQDKPCSHGSDTPPTFTFSIGLCMRPHARERVLLLVLYTILDYETPKCPTLRNIIERSQCESIDTRAYTHRIQLPYSIPYEIARQGPTMGGNPHHRYRYLVSFLVSARVKTKSSRRFMTKSTN